MDDNDNVIPFTKVNKPSCNDFHNIIERFSSTKIDKYKRGVSAILIILGHPEAFVTDLSQIGDFMLSLDPESDNNLEKLRAKINFPDLTFSSYIWEIGKFLEE